MTESEWKKKEIGLNERQSNGPKEGVQRRVFERGKEKDSEGFWLHFSLGDGFCIRGSKMLFHSH